MLRLIPDATELIDKLTIQAEKVNRIGQDLTFDITGLREKIALSREEAGRVSVLNRELSVLILCWELGKIGEKIGPKSTEVCMFKVPPGGQQEITPLGSFADSCWRDVHEEHDTATEEPQVSGASGILHQTLTLLQDD